jgi:hypothetical protein
MFGDVDAGADESLELAGGPEVGRAALQQPAPGPVVALQAEFHFVRPARVEGGVVGVEHAVEVGRMQVVAPAIAESCSMARPTKSSQRWLNQVQRLSGPLIQMSTGAALAVVRKAQLALAQRRLARVRLVMSRTKALNTRSSPNPMGEIASSTGISCPSRCSAESLDALVEHARHAGLDVAAQALAMLGDAFSG